MKPEEIKSALQTQIDDAVNATMAKIDSGDITTIEDAVKDVCDALEGAKGEKTEEQVAGETEAEGNTSLGGLGLGMGRKMNLK